jgi:hypothetical protein
MRGLPLSIEKSRARPLPGIAQGGLAPLAGGAAVLAAWGERTRPGFPRGNGKGVSTKVCFLAAAAGQNLPLTAFFATAARPASIRMYEPKSGS